MNFLILPLLFVTCAVARSVFPPFPDPEVQNIHLDGHIYFTDTSPIPVLRSRAEAAAWCRSQGAEILKVTNYNLYNDLRLSFTGPATYWIDGIDKENHERFTTTNNCTPDQLDYSGFPANYLHLPASSCLALVIGSSQSSSRIEAMDCTIPNRVLCSRRRFGCTLLSHLYQQ